jgi:hypothetical protein
MGWNFWDSNTDRGKRFFSFPKPSERLWGTSVSYSMGAAFFLGGGGINPLNAELNPIRHLLALVGARHIVHVRRIRVKAASV